MTEIKLLMQLLIKSYETHTYIVWTKCRFAGFKIGDRPCMYLLSCLKGLMGIDWVENILYRREGKKYCEVCTVVTPTNRYTSVQPMLKELRKIPASTVSTRRARHLVLIRASVLRGTGRKCTSDGGKQKRFISKQFKCKLC
jgi:hypothetical protein